MQVYDGDREKDKIYVDVYDTNGIHHFEYDGSLPVGDRLRKDYSTYYVPSNMKYKDWKQKFVKDSISDDTKKTYVKYQQVLGDNSARVKFL